MIGRVDEQELAVRIGHAAGDPLHSCKFREERHEEPLVVQIADRDLGRDVRLTTFEVVAGGARVAPGVPLTPLIQVSRDTLSQLISMSLSLSLSL